MNKTESISKTDLEALVRCPKCQHLPEVKIEDNGAGYSVELFCEESGYSALGSSLEQAKAHWNIFVAFMKKAA